MINCIFIHIYIFTYIYKHMYRYIYIFIHGGGGRDPPQKNGTTFEQQTKTKRLMGVRHRCLSQHDWCRVPV